MYNALLFLTTFNYGVLVLVGLELDVVDKGINGCLVRDIKAGSATDLDGRLQRGDYVVRELNLAGVQ